MWGSPGIATQPATLLTPEKAPQAGFQVQKVIRRVGEQAIWSTQRYPDGTVLASTSAEVFATPQGSNGQGFAAGTNLSLPETSMKEGGRISAQYSFTVDAVSFHAYYQRDAQNVLSPIVYQDIANAQQNLVLAWRFNQSIFEIAPVVLVGAGGGVYGTTADTGGADGGAGAAVIQTGSREALNNGNGNVWIYRLMPVMLPANTTFRILYVWGDFAAPVDGGPNNLAVLYRTHLIGRFQTAIATG